MPTTTAKDLRSELKEAFQALKGAFVEHARQAAPELSMDALAAELGVTRQALYSGRFDLAEAVTAWNAAHPEHALSYSPPRIVAGSLAPAGE
jgi:hypothetical protein